MFSYLRDGSLCRRPCRPCLEAVAAQEARLARVVLVLGRDERGLARWCARERVQLVGVPVYACNAHAMHMRMHMLHMYMRGVQLVGVLVVHGVGVRVHVRVDVSVLLQAREEGAHPALAQLIGKVVAIELATSTAYVAAIIDDGASGVEDFKRGATFCGDDLASEVACFERLFCPEKLLLSGFSL